MYGKKCEFDAQQFDSDLRFQVFTSKVTTTRYPEECFIDQI